MRHLVSEHSTRSCQVPEKKLDAISFTAKEPKCDHDRYYQLLGDLQRFGEYQETGPKIDHNRNVLTCGLNLLQLSCSQTARPRQSWSWLQFPC